MLSPSTLVTLTTVQESSQGLNSSSTLGNQLSTRIQKIKLYYNILYLVSAESNNHSTCAITEECSIVGQQNSNVLSSETEDDEADQFEGTPVLFLNQDSILKKPLSLKKILQHFAAYTNQKRKHMTYLLRLFIHHKPAPAYEMLPTTGDQLMYIDGRDITASSVTVSMDNDESHVMMSTHNSENLTEAPETVTQHPR